TGPGNMVIDAVTEQVFHKPYDRDGRIAASGTALENVVRSILRAPFFRQKPPKTAGREEFGREFATDFVRRCGHASKADIVATATALTARSIADAVRRFVVRRNAGYQELLISGGSATNRTLPAIRADQLSPVGISMP